MTNDLNNDMNTCFQPLLYNQDRHLILKGTAGSGKSKFAVQKKVLRCLSKYEGEHKFLVTRKVQRTIKESIWEEFRERVSKWGLKNRVYYHENRSDLKMYIDNSEIVFMGLDDPEKLKSIQGITGGLCEELSEFDMDDYDMVHQRIRGNTKHYKQVISMFNPVDENLWFKGRYFDQEQTSVTTHESTFEDNKFIDEEYKQLLYSYKDTNPLYYDVYCLGKWGVTDPSGKFLYAWDDEKHVKKGLELDPSLPLRLTFDFNIEPFTVSVYQRHEPKTLKFVDKIRLNNSDILQVCDVIRAKYPGYYYIVTGDASGRNSTGTTRGKTSYWKEIKNELGLRDNQIRVRGKNKGLIDSRAICNGVLSTCDVQVDERCKELINDAKFAKVDEFGVLVKDRKENKNDFLDGFRYALDAEFPDYLDKKHKYK